MQEKNSGVLPEYVLAELLGASVPEIIILAKKKKKSFFRFSQSKSALFPPFLSVTQSSVEKIKTISFVLNHFVLVAQMALCRRIKVECNYAHLFSAAENL